MKQKINNKFVALLTPNYCKTGQKLDPT